jgi:hypothetical protein
VTSLELFARNFILVEAADNTATLAEMTPFGVGQNSMKKGGGKADDIHEEFPSLVAAGELFGGVARGSVK